ncbi:M61 family metallopeptidase [Sphingomonas melonis]|uniref:Putative metalloprotease with PDZ domain n=1 Tax=Sphingomonas melonis TaxID=152682 RepID=A0A7Y9FPU6_9SPHN|nr:putative metalloprotease with PDZ domain [Sphingomonas melonis]
MSHLPPQPLPEPAGIPEPADTPYDGTLRLRVDATDVRRGIFRVRETIPVAGPGELILLYPKWLPGFHAPQAPIELFAGLRVHVGDLDLTWRRHPSTINAFYIDVPDGTDAVEAEFQFLSPTDATQGRVLCTPEMLCLPWNTVLLYPAGHFARQIPVAASIVLPDGWQQACALATVGSAEGVIHFEQTTVDVLVDSPLLAGRHFHREALDDHVHLTMAADQPHQLGATPAQIAVHRRVVEQASRLFRSRPYDRFEMLLALSDTMTSAGIEHHRSFEAVSIADYFSDWDATFARRDTVPHEFVHSWNGKHRRGADSWQPCFERPIRNSLMWVYEGQTQYWSQVLSARSGMWTADQALGALAQTAARYDIRPGSRWRPMIDTTRDPIIAARAPLPWTSWQRSEDYYAEGSLMWLDVDTRLRELTGEARSLDDFARAFFAADDGDWTTRTYDHDEVIATLQGVAAFDWEGYFSDQLTQTHDRAPLAGIERGGYRLVFRDEPSDFQRSYEAVFGQIDLTHTLGLTVTPAGKVTDVLWDGPAFMAEMTIGTEIRAVNGRRFSPETLRRAVRAGGAVSLLTAKAQAMRTVEVMAPGGLRFPHLAPIKGEMRRLDAILAAL